MAKAIKSFSIFTTLFIFFLVVSEMPEIEAHESECLKEYGGDVGFPFCAPLIFPSICYRNCKKDKGAKGGICMSEFEEGGDIKCYCNFCSDSPFLIEL